MEDLKERLLDRYNEFKGVGDDAQDVVVGFALETAIYHVLDYCNIDLPGNWPMALDNVVILMVDDFVSSSDHNKTAEELEKGSIKSITQGDVSVSRELDSERMHRLASISNPFKNYTKTLNRHRRLKR